MAAIHHGQKYTDRHPGTGPLSAHEPLTPLEFMMQWRPWFTWDTAVNQLMQRWRTQHSCWRYMQALFSRAAPCRLQDLLDDPNPNSPAQADAYMLFTRERSEYRRRVRAQVGCGTCDVTTLTSRERF